MHTPTAGLANISRREDRNYSISRALLAASDPQTHRGFETEVSQEISRQTGRTSAGILMPTNVKSVAHSRAASVAAFLGLEGERTTSGTAYGATINAGQGGANLVATNLLTGSFIDVLRNKCRVAQAGAVFLPGLTGNALVPRRSAAAAATWLSPEGADVTEAEAIFDGSVLMTPKTIGARAQMTRQMLLQATPEIEKLVEADFAAVLALAIDSAALNGTGASGQPTGVLNVSGIGSVPMGANGAALTNLDPLIALETLLATANVDDADFGYITNPKVVSELRTLKDTTNRYLWDASALALIGQTGRVAGYLNGIPTYRTNQVPSNLVKGTSGAVCSAAVFGNWSDLLIGEWGVLEILPNPYGAGFQSGSIDLRVMQTVDVKVRHAASFAAIQDIL